MNLFKDYCNQTTKKDLYDMAVNIVIYNGMPKKDAVKYIEEAKGLPLYDLCYVLNKLIIEIKKLQGKK
jgi:hypothetical protein